MKLSGKKNEGWQEVECLKTCTVFADSGPNAVVEGKKYFIDGSYDGAIFKPCYQKKVVKKEEE